MALLFYTLYGFAIIFFAGWWFVWLLHLLAIFNGKMKLHKKKALPPLEVPLPGVSIIKPLTGVDPNLFSNLESFFTMNYPQFELLFCIQDEGDPSIMLVRRLMEKHPLVDARVFVGGCPVGVNPKINNMQPGYEAAKYELILISDSGIRMKEDTLLDMVLTMADDVALVHQMPFACDRKGFPAILEKVYFGTAHARIYLAADFLRINCATGMSALMRKKLLDEVGGIRAFGHYLAEDFFFAKSFEDRGWKIRISSQPAWQNSGLCEVGLFQTRVASDHSHQANVIKLSLGASRACRIGSFDNSAVHCRAVAEHRRPLWSDEPCTVVSPWQVGQASVCHAAAHHAAGAPVGVHAAGGHGGMGDQLPLPVGRLRRVPAASAALVPARLDAAQRRAGACPLTATTVPEKFPTRITTLCFIRSRQRCGSYTSISLMEVLLHILQCNFTGKLLRRVP